MKPRPRKIITCVIVFLLLGAIVNVAVAWGCCLWGVPPRETSVTPSDIRRIMAEQRVIDWRGTTRGAQGSTFGQTAIQLNDLNAIAFRISAGIPCAAIDGDYGFQWTHSLTFSDDPDGICRDWTWVVKEPNFNNELLRLYHSQGTWRAGTNAVILPFAPIWPGFAINTIFYAAVLWMVFAMPFAVRRRRRIKRGLCPACAYPVGQSPVCTECGKAVSTQTQPRRGDGM